MRITAITSAIGIVVWILLMELMGPIGIYLGFLIQMIIRSVGIAYAAKKYWPLNMSWDGVVVGVLLTFSGYVVSKIL